MVYYNEIDKFAASWLRELIKAGMIAPGEVDERSIEDVIPADIMGYSQCHFFAGLGAWSYSLRCAGWPDDRPVWTGSCPCQSFSTAGKGGGLADERHLWPAFFWLIRQCRPVVCFGEQVEAAMRYDWLDHVALDLEGEGYAVGAVSSPACGYGAPHKRQRLYWVADAGYNERPTRMPGSKQKLKESSWSRFTDNGNTGILGDSEISDGTISVRPEREQDFEPGRPGPTNGFWRDAEWLPCRDGEARPVQRETKSLFESLATRIAGDLGFVCNEGGQGFFSPLIQKTKNRVGRARGYGNAIVAPQAAAFIMAFMQKKGLI